MNRVLKHLGLLVLAGVLAGCAQLSPQQITFAPSLGPENIPQGRGDTVAVTIVDRRTTTVLGYRGGTYTQSSSITASNDIRVMLEDLTEEVLERGGYRLAGMNAELDMTIYLDELSYQLEDLDAVRKRATGAARVSVELIRDRSTYSNSFRAQRSIETFRYPSEARNDELMNQVFEMVLGRMFGDPGLENFMNAF